MGIRMTELSLYNPFIVIYLIGLVFFFLCWIIGEANFRNYEIEDKQNKNKVLKSNIKDLKSLIFGVFLWPFFVVWVVYRLYRFWKLVKKLDARKFG